MIKLSVISCIFSLLFFGCSGDNKTELKEPPPPYIIENLESVPFFAADYLLEQYKESNLFALDSVESIRPVAFKQQMGESAEPYLCYLFVGMAKRTYKTNNGKLFAELIQFADETNAYGYYALLRPTGQVVQRIGVESYQSGNSLYMVKADYVLILSSENEGNAKVMENLAITIANEIAGQKSLPPTFLLFPYKNKIIPSQQYFPYAFLDVPGCSDVYSTAYAIGSDTVTLFFTIDSTGEKFAYLKQFAQSTGKVTEPVKKFPYDNEKSFAFNLPEEGVVIAGTRLNKFVGVVGYKPESSDKLLFDWLKGIRQ